MNKKIRHVSNTLEMHYKLSGTGELVYPSKLVPGLVLSQIYTFQDFVWVLKKTIAALPRAKACS